MRVPAAPPGVESGHVTLPPENWARLKEVFADARALPANLRPAYLAAACGGNEALRREVASLLASDTDAKSFLETPAVLLADGEAKRLEGQRIGPYQITSWIGAGGMGEVYRASDTTLGRDVAIKILPRIFASDPDRLARFDREARMLASLNHPHIGAIYGVEQSEGAPALILELVEGPTLADRLAQGPMPLTESLGIARQIVDALDAAHERGIVHRDLKPANIKITPDGIVKVLDFGLAKAVASDGAARGPTGVRIGICRGYARRRDPGHPVIHESRTGAGTGGRQTDRHLVVRLRALRHADRPAGVCRRDRVGHDCRDPRTRAGLARVAGGLASADSTPASPLPRKGSHPKAGRHRRCRTGYR